MLLFLDANVLFSAAHTPGGRARGLVDLGRARRCALITSHWAIREASRNLALKAPHALDELGTILPTLGIAPDPPDTLVSWAMRQGLPEKDAPILAAAVAAGASHLVTGDRRHFAYLLGKVHQGVHVVRLADAVELVLDSLEKDTPVNGSP